MENDIKTNPAQTEENAENEQVNDPKPEENAGGNESNETIQELLAKLSQAKADVAKWKSSFDNASSQVADLKHKIRENMTQQQIDEEEKRMQEEEIRNELSSLREFKKRTEAIDRYRRSGLNDELAKKAADAEIKGDMDEIGEIYRKNTESVLKEKEKEWIKSRPDINVGNGELDETEKLRRQIEDIMLNGRR